MGEEGGKSQVGTELNYQSCSPPNISDNIFTVFAPDIGHRKNIYDCIQLPVTVPLAFLYFAFTVLFGVRL